MGWIQGLRAGGRNYAAKIALTNPVKLEWPLSQLAIIDIRLRQGGRGTRSLIPLVRFQVENGSITGVYFPKKLLKPEKYPQLVLNTLRMAKEFSRQPESLKAMTNLIAQLGYRSGEPIKQKNS